MVFDYICGGEVTGSGFFTEAKDALRVWTRPTSTQVVAGQELSNIFISASSGFYNQFTWKKKNVFSIDASQYAGSTVRIIFQWFNNSTNGAPPSAGIDNFELYYSCQEPTYPSADQNLTSNSVTVVWSTYAGATGYELRYKKVAEPETVPTYTNPVSISGANTYFYNLSGLSTSTDYVAEVKPVGGSFCSEFGGQVYFTTLTPPANDSCSGAQQLTVETAACEGVPATFFASTPTVGLGSSCPNAANNDVWFKFTATAARQIIQTKDVDYGSSNVSATDITLYTGTCGSLTQVVQPCASSSYSVAQAGIVNRLVADGLTPGTTYYVRVNINNNTAYQPFRICVYTQTPVPSCPTLYEPANGAQLNYGIPTRFRWSPATGAAGYKVRIIEQSGAYAEFNTSDTTVTYTLAKGINYTWTVDPYTVQEITTTCAAGTFSTCAGAANGLVLSTPDGTSKCAGSAVRIKVNSSTNVQWFYNNQPINGATGDSVNALLEGSYTVRIKNGSCYSDPTTAVVITNLPTPIKPQISPANDTTFCQGGSVTFTTAFNVNNQWFAGSTALAGATGTSYTANTTGNYYLRYTNSGSGCSSYSDTVVVTVTAPPATPVITVTNGPAICTGDSARLKSSVNSGNQWYRNGTLISGATDTVYFAKTAGDYTVKAANGTCISAFSAAVTITINTIPAAPVISLTGSNTVCSGDSVKLTSSVASGNQWFFNNTAISGATGTIHYAKNAGNYTVKQTVNNCISPASTAQAVALNPLPAKPAIAVAGNGYVLSTSATATAYQWYLNNSPIAGATSTSYTVLALGNYTVQITDANGCKNTSDAYNAVTTGLNDVELAGYKISFFPNPVSSQLQITVNAGNAVRKNMELTVSDLAGRKILQTVIRPGSNSISLATLSPGHYFITIRDTNGFRTVKIQKQ